MPNRPTGRRDRRATSAERPPRPPGPVERTTATRDEPETFEMCIERGKIREFAHATKSANDEYLAESAPICPVTFLTTATFWKEGMRAPWAGVGRHPDRVLHGGEEVIYHGPPPRAGTVLSVRVWTDRQFEKVGSRGGNLTFIERASEFYDGSGQLVAETRATFIETSRPPTEATATASTSDDK